MPADICDFHYLVDIVAVDRHFSDMGAHVDTTDLLHPVSDPFRIFIRKLDVNLSAA